MSDTLYLWFAGAPGRYWILAIPVGVAFLIAALFTQKAPRWLFLTLLAVTLLAFRWPAVVIGGEANVDESQAIAAAITLNARPVFWRDVDAHAIGPLAVYPLALAGALGAPLDYQTARLIGLFAEWLALACMSRLLLEYFGERWSRLGILPATCFLACARHFDFWQYSSEIIALALTSLGASLAWIGVRRRSRWMLFAGGAVLASTLWVKLQAAPIAATLIVGAGAALGFAAAPERKDKWRLVASLAAGSTALFLLPMVALAAMGIWTDSYDAYVRAGMDYIGETEQAPPTVLWRFFHDLESGFPAYALPGLAVVAGLAWRARRAADGVKPLLLSFAAAVAVGCFVVAMPGRFFLHYLVLLLFPLGFLAAACAASALPAVEDQRRSRQAGVALAWLVPTLGFQVAYLVSNRAPAMPMIPGANRLVTNEATALIGREARPGDAMTVWGWEPRMHVVTGLPHATREAHSERLIQDAPMRDFYRKRFLEDFRRNRPTYFVDGVVPENFIFNDRSRYGFTLWPEFGQLIAMEYSLVGTGNGYRIYRRIAPP